MKRELYSATIRKFLSDSEDTIWAKITRNSEFADELTQKHAWDEEIRILKETLIGFKGSIYFEYSIPRMGKRVDVIVLIKSVIFVLEFKVGESEFTASAIDQVFDYAMDLKNFHSTSYDHYIAPILIATHSDSEYSTISLSHHFDKIFLPTLCNPSLLKETLTNISEFADDDPINIKKWESGRYSPSPTIVEAALALYRGHSVENISRSDAGAINLRKTSRELSKIIEFSKSNSLKSICFVTGVPGAGKTLVGLKIAIQHIDPDSELYSVFLSGNGPLVAILREALYRDQIHKKKKDKYKFAKGEKGEIKSKIKAFIQNVHHFRDEYLKDIKVPKDHVALFDEAQRAWNLTQTISFMKQKRGQDNFSKSEPEFLISCLDRHKDWAVVVCLVGGGQEIHTGEAGISEWINSIIKSYPKWNIYISNKLTDSEYNAIEVLKKLETRKNVFYKKDLHLSVSMRSFRAENVSLFVKQLLDTQKEEATQTLLSLKDKYPIVLTRDLSKAKKWLKEKARGSERYGLVVSSQAERLRPHGIFVKSPIDPVHYFLHGKDDVRSSYYLEDVATEFHIQGLELDWACITWDADFRFHNNNWSHFSFKGNRWERIKKPERQSYQKNAYRVLLTRARQGMVIVVPEGNHDDMTRLPKFYDPIYKYLESVGLEVLE
jgi:shikimate kinase